MTVEVLLFAQLAEAIGKTRVTVELADDATVADALATLATKHAVIAAMQDRIAIAVDETYARPETVLRAGQIIALIPPVSGG